MIVYINGISYNNETPKDFIIDIYKRKRAFKFSKLLCFLKPLNFLSFFLNHHYDFSFALSIVKWKNWKTVNQEASKHVLFEY
jgi:hypothetical protein